MADTRLSCRDPAVGAGHRKPPADMLRLGILGRSEQGLCMNDRVSTRYNVQYQGRCVEPMGVSSQEFVPFHGSSA